MAATLASSMASSISVKGLSASRSALAGNAVTLTQAAPVKSGSVQCRASAEEQSSVSRRAALTLLAGAAAVTLKANPAFAAYGEAANVFGKFKGATDYIPYQGEGFSIDLPSKWNPSKEAGEFPNIVLRYEDNFDALCNLVVIVEPTSLRSAKDIGGPEDFINKFNYLLGVQSFAGETISEGGFDPNATITASILDSETVTVNGVDYLKLNVLSRAADGNEGGRHVLFSVAVKDGKLYIARVSAGDKRWFKGAKKFVEGAAASFAVA